MRTHKSVYSISLGCWYARTQLHLSEVFSFLENGTSHLPLDTKRLQNLHQNLHIASIRRVVDFLEYIEATTRDGVLIRYYEDGLYTLSKDSDSIVTTKKELSDYYQQCFSPAMQYLFSLGAPTPKVLAKIPSLHPFAIYFAGEVADIIGPDDQLFDFVHSAYSQVTTSDKKISLFATKEQILLVSSHFDATQVNKILEAQIFFREFKNQLTHYLNTHRTTWEEISELKEKKRLSASELEKVRLELENDQKTITLISSRINQMRTYIQTRSSITEKLHIDDYLLELFQYRFDTLSSAHEYVRELWKMTQDYTTQAISMAQQVESRSVSHNLKTVAFITSLGTFSFITSLFAKTELPKITPTGSIYVVMMLAFATMVNGLAYLIFKRVKYDLVKK